MADTDERLVTLLLSFVHVWSSRNRLLDLSECGEHRPTDKGCLTRYAPFNTLTLAFFINLRRELNVRAAGKPLRVPWVRLIIRESNRPD